MLLRIIAFLGALAIAALGELLPALPGPAPWTWAPALGLGLLGLRWLGAREPQGRTTRSQVLFLWLLLAVVLHLLGWARWVLLDLGWLGRPFATFALLLLPFAALSPGLRGSGRLFAALSIVPAAVLLCLEAAWSAPAVVETVETAASLQVLAISVTVGIAMPAAPSLILLAVPSQAFPPGSLRDALERWAERLGVRLRSVRLFGEETGSQLNACAVGFLRGTRRVFFTRGIVRHLDVEQLAAVFCHGFAHFARGHFRVYALLVASFLWSLTPLLEATGGLPEAAGAAILLCYAAFFWGFLHCAVARRLETDADLTAARAVGFELYASTLAWTGAAQGGQAHVHGLRHASLSSRERLVLDCGSDAERHARELERTRRMERRVHGLTALCAAAFLACATADALRDEAETASLKGELALARAAELLPVLEHSAAADPAVPRWLSWAARDRGSLTREIADHLDRARAHLRVAAARETPALEEPRRRLEAVQVRRSSP